MDGEGSVLSLELKSLTPEEAMTSSTGARSCGAVLTTSFLFAINTTATAAVLSVDDDGVADFPTIQDAVIAANDNDIIVVMPGRYTSKGTEVVNLLGKKIELVSVEGPDVTFIDGEDIRRCIVCTSGEGSDTKIDGFSIIHGLGDEIGGGGILIEDSTPDIANCIFRDNRAAYEGAAARTNVLGNAGPSFTNCEFFDNLVDHDLGAGGALFIEGSAAIYNSDFTNNMTGYGGAVYFWKPGSQKLHNCLFNRNKATSIGGAVRSYGDNLNISECNFIENMATSEFSHGGAIAAYDSSGSINECNFQSNTTSGLSGGALLLEESSTSITHSLFEDNMVNDLNNDSAGAAVTQFGGNVLIINSVLRDHIAATGATIYSANGTLELQGCSIIEGRAVMNSAGAIYAGDTTTLNLLNCDFRQNLAIGAGAIHAGNNVTATNCTFDDNEAEFSSGGHLFLHGHGSGSTFTNCTFTNGSAENHGGAISTHQLGAITFLDCNFTANRTRALGDDATGAVSIFSDPDHDHPVQFDGCLVLNNDMCCVMIDFFAGTGGGIYSQGETISISNSRFQSNHATRGGSISAKAHINNCVIHGNVSLLSGGGLDILDGSTVRNCKISGTSDCTGGAMRASGDVVFESVTVTGGSAEGIGQCWEFLLPEQLAACVFEPDSQVSLENCSICNGNPNQVTGDYLDLGGNRISDECCLEDLNHDGQVNGGDLANVLANWGQPGLGTQTDINDDGEINGADLALLLAGWGGCN